MTWCDQHGCPDSVCGEFRHDIATAPRRTQIVVCGGRNFYGGRVYEAWFRGLLELHRPCVVHHGDCFGADRWAAAIASTVQGVRVVAHPAQWGRYGRAAGPRRNAAMLAAAGAHALVVAFPGGRGTADTVAKARAGGVAVCGWLDG